MILGRLFWIYPLFPCFLYQFSNCNVSYVSSYANQGYYGDDRPRRRGLNEVEGDYSDYIEMEDREVNDDGQDEEGNREYAYDQNGYMVPV